MGTILTLLKDITVMHRNCCGVCGSAVQHQTCRPPVGKAERRRVKAMLNSSDRGRGEGKAGGGNGGIVKAQQ